MRLLEGKLDAKGIRIAVVLSKFNSFISERLLEGAKDAFFQLNGEDDKLDVYKVPGAFEIAGAAKRLESTGKYDAIVCLGVIIRGETPHFEYVAGNSAKAIMNLSAAGQIPVIYGMVTANDLEQAVNRAGVKMGNKGYSALSAAVEMVSLYREIK